MLAISIYLIGNILYAYLAAATGYITLFSVASRFFKPGIYPETDLRRRFVFLIPAYKEDTVINACVTSILQQAYPSELYDILVISDHISLETNATLRRKRITLIELEEKESSKAKALRIASARIQHQEYDYAVILDADNLIAPCYLHELNKALLPGIKALQTHRKAKNMNTGTAILDAIIEEMNNSVFRKGHVRLGFSSALAGSGMVFDFRWFVQNIPQVHSSGEDKELEELLLRQGIRIAYADKPETLDEKVQTSAAMRIQRRRWMATQLFLALRMGRKVPSALLAGNTDYALKAFQAFILPRSILVSLTGIVSLTIGIFSPSASIKWWLLFLLLVLSLYTAIPLSMRCKYTGKMIRHAPRFMLTMIANLFHLKGMAKKFVHTQHG